MRKTLMVALLALVCLSFAFAGVTYRLPVFETSDVHGYIVDTSSGDESTYQYRLAFIADKVNDARNGDPSTTILLDGGDIYQGNVISNLQTGGPLVAAYQAMGYDAVTIGNHEFDWGINVTVDSDCTMPSYSFGSYTGDSLVPVVCSNLYLNGEKVTFASDYVIIEKNAVSSSGDKLAVTVGIIGYNFDYSSSIIGKRFSNLGFSIQPNLAGLESLASKLESEMGCDAVIVITHEEPSYLAKNLKQGSAVDLVCGGHTHANTIGSVHGISYIQSASQAVAYAYAELVFETNAIGKVSSVNVSGAKAVSVTGSANLSKTYDKPANASELDPEVLAISKAGIQASKSALDATLGYVTVNITKNAIGINTRSSVAGNWLADLMARSVDAQVAFVNNGGIRTTFKTTNGRKYICAGDIYSISPFANAVYKYEITYAELLELLRYSLDKGAGFELRMSGIDCYYVGKAINGLKVNGTVIYRKSKWVDDWADKKVTVATNEYIATAEDSPFYKWNSTSRLLGNDAIDNEGAIDVLREEAAISGGFLYVDTSAHMIVGIL